MKRSILASLLLLPSLSACGGLGQSASGALSQDASLPRTPDAAVREAASDSLRLPIAPFVTGPSYRLYVANAGNNSITVYHTTASGNAAPIATIIGSNTQLGNPGQLSEDANGNLYVANGIDFESPQSSILVFPNGANGNIVPIRVLAGSLTGFAPYFGNRNRG